MTKLLFITAAVAAIIVYDHVNNGNTFPSEIYCLMGQEVYGIEKRAFLFAIIMIVSRDIQRLQQPICVSTNLYGRDGSPSKSELRRGNAREISSALEHTP